MASCEGRADAVSLMMASSEAGGMYKSLSSEGIVGAFGCVAIAAPPLNVNGSQRHSQWRYSVVAVMEIKGLNLGFPIVHLLSKK